MMDWEKAEEYLNKMIAEYAAIGSRGLLALQLTLLPLKNRFDSGERTVQLYDEIMECE